MWNKSNNYCKRLDFISLQREIELNAILHIWDNGFPLAFILSLFGSYLLKDNWEASNPFADCMRNESKLDSKKLAEVHCKLL